MSSGLVAPLDEQRSLLGRSPTRPALHHGAAMGRAFISSGGATFRPARGRAAAARLLWLAKVHVGPRGLGNAETLEDGLWEGEGNIGLSQLGAEPGEELNLAIKGADESPSKYFPAARLRGLACLLLRRTVEQGGWTARTDRAEARKVDPLASSPTCWLDWEHRARSNRARREEVTVKQPSSQLDKPRRNPPCVKTGVHGPCVCVLFPRAAADVQDAAGKAAFVDPAPGADEVVSYRVPCNNSEAQRQPPHRDETARRHLTYVDQGFSTSPTPVSTYLPLHGLGQPGLEEEKEHQAPSPREPAAPMLGWSVIAIQETACL
ncbi:hypothetical protein CMUS01_01675 [Colletotrichum musicola]|uniref:Uncharacterized protein n=1 Tax=Colletotrichum musicola TaxID=2175873 RepID=A0A8H6NWD1_9PEZI|nr:hypothetical protein CMUS01_01675 [Colletotrichum musicola]